MRIPYVSQGEVNRPLNSKSIHPLEVGEIGHRYYVLGENMTKYEQLLNLARTAVETAQLPLLGYEKVKSAYVTMDAKALKAILLQTGGVFTRNIKGKVVDFRIHKVPLGLGVYNVYAETINSLNVRDFPQ